ncbi:PIG-L deacetylase family protein [Moorena producens]|uniref:PIG-L deacetylase family protein n=1 Tax=Moorena producens TaxID=1155739 RepID=UPI003C77A288
MNILVVAAHPDDEVLGCGGTIAKHAHSGDVVNVLILAEGATSRNQARSREICQNELSELAKAAQTASRILGVSSVRLHDFPDNRMDGVDLLDIVKVVESAIDDFLPEIVYTHHVGDVNIDHKLIHRAVVTACRPVPQHPVHTLLFFEIPSSSEWQPPGSAPIFAPNWFVDVTETLNLKLKALEAYQSEMRPWPHPRSLQAVEHLARWRGASVGVEAAEAFIVGRQVM